MLYRIALESANLLKVSLVTGASMVAIYLLALIETTNTAEAEDSLSRNGKIAFRDSASRRVADVTISYRAAVQSDGASPSAKKVPAYWRSL